MAAPAPTTSPLVRRYTMDEFFELDVPRDRALDAFHHPYAYLARAQAGFAVEPVAA